MADILENAVGKSVEFRIGNTVIDLYPIMIRDWTETSKLMYILNFESLADIAYVGALDSLKQLIMIAARSGEISNTDHFSVLELMTNEDYKWLRNILSAQNDIDMDRLLDKVSKISGKPKN